MVHIFFPRLPYTPAIDITELVSLETVVRELSLGPNGGLLYCIEYLEKNVDWLVEKVKSLPECNYVLFDLPGQVRMLTSPPLMANMTIYLCNNRVAALLPVFIGRHRCAALTL